MRILQGYLVPSKMAVSSGKSTVVREITEFSLLCDDDDDLVLVAFEGLKDLAQLGSERFAKTACFVVNLVHFTEMQPA